MSTVLVLQPQRLCVRGPGMCLSVLPACSCRRCCCSSVRLISSRSAYLSHTAELFILFSMADLGLWDMFPGSLFFLFSLCSFYFWGCYLLNWSHLWRSSIFPSWRKCVGAAGWGRLLSAVETQITAGKRSFCYDDAFHSEEREAGGGPPGALELWKHRPVWSGTPGRQMEVQ